MKKTALLVIDMQNDFCEINAPLRVPYAGVDCMLAADFIRNNHYIDKIYLSLDTHQIHQIFHPGFWEPQPKPFSNITLEDFKNNRWKPSNAAINISQEYLGEVTIEEYIEHYLKTTPYPLTIWPLHALLGSHGHSLHPSVHRAAAEHSIKNGYNLSYMLKGYHPLTEFYSIWTPAVAVLPDGESLGVTTNERYFNELREFDKVYIVGEAKSHCVLWTITDMLNYFEPGQLCAVTNIMSSIDGCKDATDLAFIELEKKGVHMLDWHMK